MSDFERKIRRLPENLPVETRAQVQVDLDYLLSTGVKSYESLLALVQNRHADTKARSIGCWVIGKLGNKQAAKALLAAFDSQDVTLQWEAAVSLGFLATKRAVRPLVKALLQGTPTEKRSAAAYGLGYLSDDRAIEPLLKTLNSKGESPGLRGHVAEALASFKTSLVVENLIKALNDDEAEVRYNAAYALGKIGDKKALPALRKLAKKDHEKILNWGEVREMALMAIANINKAPRN